MTFAVTAEKAVGNRRMKEQYMIAKTLSNVNAVKDKSGNVLIEETARKEKWREYFEEILNRPTPDDPITEEECDPVIE